MKQFLNNDESKTNVLQKLRTNQVAVKFTKADGTERRMLCTLVESKIPSEKLPKTQSTEGSTTGSAVRVFDVEKSEWRSFRWDSLIGVEYD